MRGFLPKKRKKKKKRMEKIVNHKINVVIKVSTQEVVKLSITIQFYTVSDQK